MGNVNEEKLKLYIRLPVKIIEELQVKALHPDIQQVFLPRQKSRRWCIVSFASEEILKEARTKLRATQIKGKKIHASLIRKKKQPPSAIVPKLDGEASVVVAVEKKPSKKCGNTTADSLLDLLKPDEK